MIDPIRVEIVRLENESIFRGAPWYEVINTLLDQGRPAAAADAERRMITARQNCKCETCQRKIQLERESQDFVRKAGEDIRQIIQRVAIETEA